MNYKKIICLFIVFFVDQILKYIISINNTSIAIIDNFFYIDYSSNTGAAFSILSGHNILLIVVSLILCVVLYHFMYSFKDNKYNSIAFGILFGGILGNLADRLFVGYVRDFISFKIGSYFFPTFNIADMAIIIGVVLIGISSIKEELSKRGNKSRGRKKRKA